MAIEPRCTFEVAEKGQIEVSGFVSWILGQADLWMIRRADRSFWWTSNAKGSAIVIGLCRCAGRTIC